MDQVFDRNEAIDLFRVPRVRGRLGVIEKRVRFVGDAAAAFRRHASAALASRVQSLAQDQRDAGRHERKYLEKDLRKK